MAFLFHMVPPDMHGHVLYPLNALKDVRPDLYQAEAAKYEGRGRLLTRRIEPLDCLWNDVLHLTAIEPAVLKAALVDAGASPNPWSFYCIDPAALDMRNAMVFLSRLPMTEMGIDPRDFAPYDPAGVEPYAQVPEATKAYYRARIAEGKRPLLFAHAPHIFYRGPIDVSSCEIVTV